MTSSGLRLLTAFDAIEADHSQSSRKQTLNGRSISNESDRTTDVRLKLGVGRNANVCKVRSRQIIRSESIGDRFRSLRVRFTNHLHPLECLLQP